LSSNAALRRDGRPASPELDRARRSDAGFSLIEVVVATGIMATALVMLAQLFGLSTRSNIGARNTTYAAVLAQQKVEELRALTWGFDPLGLPMSDTTTNTAVYPETQDGKGLQPSPATALNEDTDGYVDYVDAYGNKMNRGDRNNKSGIYTRRWSITPLPTNPNDTIIIQVLVTRAANRGSANDGNVARLPEEARLVTVKTRKAQ
jgi:prepilin-type N-terminal cleavage/methylation domain-containing protein